MKPVKRSEFVCFIVQRCTGTKLNKCLFSFNVKICHNKTVVWWQCVIEKRNLHRNFFTLFVYFFSYRSTSVCIFPGLFPFTSPGTFEILKSQDFQGLPRTSWDFPGLPRTFFKNIHALRLPLIDTLSPTCVISIFFATMHYSRISLSKREPCVKMVVFFLFQLSEQLTPYPQTHFYDPLSSWISMQ